MKYKSRQVIVEAVQFDAERWFYMRKEAYPMVTTRDCNHGYSSLGGFFTYEPVLETPYGDIRLMYDDYIIKAENGELYTCRPDTFKKVYESFGEEL